MGEWTQEIRTLLNQDMGEVNANNRGKILGSREELSPHFMSPLINNFSIRDLKMLNLSVIRTFTSAASFSIDCFTADFLHFVDSEQLKVHTFALDHPIL